MATGAELVRTASKENKSRDHERPYHAADRNTNDLTKRIHFIEQSVRPSALCGTDRYEEHYYRTIIEQDAGNNPLPRGAPPGTAGIFLPWTVDLAPDRAKTGPCSVLGETERAASTQARMEPAFHLPVLMVWIKVRLAKTQRGTRMRCLVGSCSNRSPRASSLRMEFCWPNLPI